VRRLGNLRLALETLLGRDAVATHVEVAVRAELGAAFQNEFDGSLARYLRGALPGRMNSCWKSARWVLFLIAAGVVCALVVDGVPQ
jgi:hypothetical protein